MNNAQIKGLRMTAADHAMGANYDATRLTISKTDAGWEASRGGKLVGVCQTREGAKELLSVECSRCRMRPGVSCWEPRKPGAYEGRRVKPHQERIAAARKEPLDRR